MKKQRVIPKDWKYGRHGEDHHIEVVYFEDGLDYPICSLEVNKNDEALADLLVKAWLIPELLAACKAVVDTEISSSTGTRIAAYEKAAFLCEAAIAKAEGKE